VIKYLLIFTLLGNLCYADTNVTFLPKGSTTPYDGYLFTPDAATTAYKAEQQLPQYKLLNESLTTSLTLEQNNTKQETDEKQICMTDNQNLRTSLEKTKETSTLEKILYIGIGIVVTGLAVDLGSKVTR
jgi:hypothetical protein